MGGVKPHHGIPVFADEKLQLHSEGGDFPSLGLMPATHPDTDLEIEDELLLRHLDAV
jgi:hypothetical protein